MFDQATTGTPARPTYQAHYEFKESVGKTVTRPGEWYDPDRIPDKLAKTLRDHMVDDRIELDPRNKSHPRKSLQEYRIIGKKRGYNASNLTAREQLDASCSIRC